MPIASQLHPLLRALLHRGVVAMLVVCSFACCCRERAIGAIVSGNGAAVASAGCCDGCCGRATEVSDGDGRREDHEPRDRGHHPVGRCDNGCCTKADLKTPQFEVGCDRVGAPLDSIVTVCDAPRDHAGVATRLDDDVGEPPPWLRLIVTARLRI